MQLTYRGSVNRWECDENDHLNVRFCEQKLYQTLLSGLLEHHCLTREDIGRLPAMILRQHIRFQAESRIAAPMTERWDPETPFGLCRVLLRLDLEYSPLPT